MTRRQDNASAIFHPLTVNCVLFALLRPQLVCLRGCLFCSRKEEAAICQRHKHSKRTVRRKEHKILRIFSWVTLTEFTCEKNTKETFLPQKARACSIPRGEISRGTLDNESQGVKKTLVFCSLRNAHVDIEIMSVAQLLQRVSPFHGSVSGSTWQLGLCSRSLNHHLGCTRMSQRLKDRPSGLTETSTVNWAVLAAELETHREQMKWAHCKNSKCPPSTLCIWTALSQQPDQGGYYFPPPFTYGGLKPRAFPTLQGNGRKRTRMLLLRLEIACIARPPPR